MDSYLRRLETFGFSGVVLAARRGDIVLHRAYGLADRAAGVRMRTDTLLHIGSIAKQFTAAAILKLEMQGRVRTQDSLSRFFPDAPPGTRDITLHQLLTHTAGFPARSYQSADDPTGRSAISRDEVVRGSLALPLAFVPGTGYQYSNVGYNLLAAVVEIASGEPFGAYLQHHLFASAGLTDTVPLAALAETVSARFAHGYDGDDDHGTVHDWSPNCWRLYGAGGIESTAADLYRWHTALATDRVLSAAARRKLVTPYADEGGGTQYAYGWVVGQTARGTTSVWHDGGIRPESFYALFARYVAEDAVLIVLTNATADGVPVRHLAAANLERLLFGASISVPPSVAGPQTTRSLGDYIGSYRSESGATVQVTASGNEIRLMTDDPTVQAALAFGAPRPSDAPAARQAQTLVEEMARGDYRTFRTALVPRIPHAEEQAYFERWWAAREEQLGTFQTTKVAGVGALGPDLQVVLRLHFERGVHSLVVHVTGKRLVWFDTDPRAATLPSVFRLRPQTDNRFAGVHFGLQSTLRAWFRFDAAGAVSAVILPAQRAPILLVRQTAASHSPL